MTGIIIFGSRGVERKIDTGYFHCPSCQCDSPYSRKKITRFFTLYFIPLIPLGSVGEFVRCDQCGSDYATDVLGLTRRDLQRASTPWRCAACKNVNPPEYSECVSCGHAR